MMCAMRTDDAVTPSAAKRGRNGYGPHFVQSVARALAVLKSFSGERPKQTLADVARETGLDRATARRLLLTLVDLGYVAGDGRARSRLEAAGPGGLTPLVGRERDVGLLLEQWEAAALGAARAVLLSGEAGIGK